MDNYDDIRYLPHHQSKTHPQMSLRDRAAQFSPFAALSGYDDLVRETARLTDTMAELSEDEKEKLDRSLRSVADALESGISPKVTLTCFVPDKTKAGGRYEEYTGFIKNIDSVRRIIVLRDETQGTSPREISFEFITSIEQAAKG